MTALEQHEETQNAKTSIDQLEVRYIIRQEQILKNVEVMVEL